MKRIALISEHASPLDALGGVDSGGQNVYVAQVGRHLARSGYHVDVFTRRTRPELPLVVEVQPEFRVVNVPAGPPTFVRKEELLAHMPEFTRFVLKFFGSGSPYDLLHANFWMSGLVAAEI
ncbi:MAG: glycosyltransferase, partial [Bacteroidota bacterium]